MGGGFSSVHVRVENVLSVCVWVMLLSHTPGQGRNDNLRRHERGGHGHHLPTHVESGVSLKPVNAHLQVDIEIPAAVKRSSEFLTHPIFHMYHSETDMLRYLFSLQSKDLSLQTVDTPRFFSLLEFPPRSHPRPP